MGSVTIKNIPTEQTTTNTTDWLEIQEDAGTSKKLSLTNLFKSINIFPAKTSPAGADEILIGDSADSNSPKKITKTSLVKPVVSTETSSYTITDTDGNDIIYFTGTAADSTFTLPTLADNQDRILTLVNLSATRVLTIDGEGSETINGVETIELPIKGNTIKLIGQTSEWVILDANVTAELHLRTYAGYGSTDNKIMRFTNVVTNTGNAFSQNHTSGYSSNADGLEITINLAGRYTISFSNLGGSSTDNEGGLSLNSTQLTTSLYDISEADILSVDLATSNRAGQSCVTKWFNKNDIIRPHTKGVTPYRTTGAIFIATFNGV